MHPEGGRIGPPYWDSDPVYIIGGGPSAAKVDLQALRGRTVVACNDSALALPWATAVVSVDRKWINRRASFLRSFEGAAYLVRYWHLQYPTLPRACWLEGGRGGPGLSEEVHRINHAGNTGQGALNVALLKRAREVVLIGFDMDQAGHWHPPYPWESSEDARYYRKWASSFDHCRKQLDAAGCAVFNANPNSKITAFPFAPEKVPLCT